MFSQFFKFIVFRIFILKTELTKRPNDFKNELLLSTISIEGLFLPFIPWKLGWTFDYRFFQPLPWNKEEKHSLYSKGSLKMFLLNSNKVGIE